MKYKIFIVLIVIIIAVNLLATAAADIPSSLSLSGKSAILIDADTGTIVFEYNSSERMPVASVNKIMTLYLAFKSIEEGRIHLDDYVTVSENASSMGGSQVYLEAGGQYTVNELLKSIIIASANDSCVAVGEHIAGSEMAFVDLMNQTANELGLDNSLFANCTGLPADNHYMSAADIANLSRYLLDYDLFFTYSTIWTENFVHPSGRTTLITNTNKLTQSYTGCDGIKTGFTNEAMYCLSASAKKGETRLIAVILGEPTSSIRNNDIAAMFNFGFANYTSKVLYSKGDIIVENLSILGADDLITNAIANKDITVFIDKSLQDSISSTITINENLTAPLLKGEMVGNVDIYVNDSYIRSEEIVLNRDVDKLTFWGCLKKVIGEFERSYFKADSPPSE